MLILGLDPGPEKSAWILYGTKEKTIESYGFNNNIELVQLLELTPRNEILVIEMVQCYGMPVGKEIFETCVWIGRFIQVWGYCCKYKRVYRTEVKLHLCNSMRAKDSNVRQVLIDRFPTTGKDSKGNPSAIGTKKYPGPLYGIKKDMWSALALAVYYAEQQEKKDARD